MCTVLIVVCALIGILVPDLPDFSDPLLVSVQFFFFFPILFVKFRKVCMGKELRKVLKHLVIRVLPM